MTLLPDDILFLDNSLIDFDDDAQISLLYDRQSSVGVAVFSDPCMATSSDLCIAKLHVRSVHTYNTAWSVFFLFAGIGMCSNVDLVYLARSLVVLTTSIDCDILPWYVLPSSRPSLAAQA